ncbi:MAG TPA: hypothetical protein VFB08_11840 [Burkholderiales bacterium]|nr:hypothetical protein [Burkholderiales bacterium]
MKQWIAGLMLSGFLACALAQAPAGEVVRIRGTVQSLEGNVLTVRTRAGDAARVRLADNAVVMGLAKASIADVTSGKFVGTTTIGERDGALIAHEIHIFPENMRGTGEGHRDWDLRPNSKMTNANVADIRSVGKDRVMSVTYKGGEKKVLIPDNAVVVAYEPADRSELKPGAPVFVNAQKGADGALAASRVNVGLRGQIPPM